MKRAKWCKAIVIAPSPCDSARGCQIISAVKEAAKQSKDRTKLDWKCCIFVGFKKLKKVCKFHLYFSWSTFCYFSKLEKQIAQTGCVYGWLITWGTAVGFWGVGEGGILSGSRRGFLAVNCCYGDVILLLGVLLTLKLVQEVWHCLRLCSTPLRCACCLPNQTPRKPVERR